MTEASGHHLWQPLSPREVAVLFANATIPWWIAGGYAIEHAVGHSIRPHADIDVLVLRRDQLQIQNILAGWNCWAADPPGTLRPWHDGEALPADVTDIWCRYEPTGAWRLQIMLDESSDGLWLSRRHRSVTRPLSELGVFDGAGVWYLAAEVQLFYKAKAPRLKDEADFVTALPHLNDRQKEWLRTAILTAYGENNPWLMALCTHSEER